MSLFKRLRKAAVEQRPITDWYRRQARFRPGLGCELNPSCLRDRKHPGECKLYEDPDFEPSGYPWYY